MKTKKPLSLDWRGLQGFSGGEGSMIEYIKQFLKIEAASGILLMLVAVCAMAVASSPYAGLYHGMLESPLTLGMAPYALTKTLSHWINDGLMVLFFLIIGQEIKYECIEGELASLKKATLPLVGALGGVLLPAAIYVFCNRGTTASHGWAIPSATDIAFSLGVLSLFGARVPAALKIFLMALAVIDDLAAILIIAFFYTESLHLPALLLAFACVVILAAMNRRGGARVLPYLLVGTVLWLAVLGSGVHATIAGVLLGVLMPLSTGKKVGLALHPWVSYGILPLFAFANAGVSLLEVDATTITHPIAVGAMLGLFIGKQVGIFFAAWMAVRCGLARLPDGVSWAQLYAVAAIAGIGFTMSLFIGTLAFDDIQAQSYVRLGVMLGSFVSALFGSALLLISFRRG